VSTFCRHGRELSECNGRCVTCGHACAEHESAGGGECSVYGCACGGWINRVRVPDDPGPFGRGPMFD
jgi:hypothetical protein